MRGAQVGLVRPVLFLRRSKPHIDPKGESKKGAHAMTVLTSPDTHFIRAVAAVAPHLAPSATLDYCTTMAREQAHAKLRDMTALETMYAYFGSDEAAV